MPFVSDASVAASATSWQPRRHINLGVYKLELFMLERLFEFIRFCLCPLEQPCSRLLHRCNQQSQNLSVSKTLDFSLANGPPPKMSISQGPTGGSNSRFGENWRELSQRASNSEHLPMDGASIAWPPHSSPE